MGNLTENMTRLRGEVDALRGAREAFISDMICEVSTLLEHFSRARSDMARKGRRERETFVSEMRRQVTNMRKEAAESLTGACLAWCGKDLRKPLEVKLNKEPEVAKTSPAPVKEAAAQKEPEAQLKATTGPPKVKKVEPVVASMGPQKSKGKGLRKGSR